MITLDTDLLVIGAGAAGLVTALSARGRRVCVLHAAGTASELAQGGIAAAVGHNDSPQLHADDTRCAGHELNDGSAVQFACERAPAAISWLESRGVRFARSGTAWSLHLEAAHSRPRVLHAGGDATGEAIMGALRQEAAGASHIEWLPRVQARGLLCDASGSGGVAATSADGLPVTVRARDVVLATGGIGALYSRTTNPQVARGDGLAMALAAGARCEQLAAVQFHPTALAVAANPLPLITEALRGAGARLIDDRGHRLMAARHPLGDLAPRDVVAGIVHAAQVAGRSVWLDATALRGTDVAHAFPSAWRQCRAHGIDPHREPIPVTCAAHYHMGGIAVDLDGRTSVPHLWAVGEVAFTGLHGANRRASNSLLEAVVFGRRLGGSAVDLAGRPRGPHVWSVGQVAFPALHGANRRASNSLLEAVVFGRRLGGVLARAHRRPAASTESAPRADAAGAATDEGLDDELGELMWRCLGPARDAASLAQGLARIAAVRAQPQPDCPARLLLIESMLRAGLAAITSDGTARQTLPGTRWDRQGAARSHRCRRGS